MITGSFDGNVAQWNLEHFSDKGLEPEMMHRVARAHAGKEVLCLSSHSLTGSIVSGGNDTRIRCWSRRDMQCVAELEGHQEGVTCLAADGALLFSGGEDDLILVWNLVDLTSAAVGSRAGWSGPLHLAPIATIIGHSKPLRGLTMLPSSRILASCADDGFVRLWDYTETTPPTSSTPRTPPEPALNLPEPAGRQVFEFSLKDSSPTCLATCQGQVSAPERGPDVEAHLFPQEHGSLQQEHRSSTLHELLVGTQDGKLLRLSIPLPENVESKEPFCASSPSIAVREIPNLKSGDPEERERQPST